MIAYCLLVGTAHPGKFIGIGQGADVKTFLHDTATPKIQSYRLKAGPEPAKTCGCASRVRNGRSPRTNDGKEGNGVRINHKHRKVIQNLLLLEIVGALCLVKRVIAKLKMSASD